MGVWFQWSAYWIGHSRNEPISGTRCSWLIIITIWQTAFANRHGLRPICLPWTRCFKLCVLSGLQIYDYRHAVRSYSCARGRSTSINCHPTDWHGSGWVDQFWAGFYRWIIGYYGMGIFTYAVGWWRLRLFTPVNKTGWTASTRDDSRVGRGYHQRCILASKTRPKLWISNRLSGSYCARGYSCGGPSWRISPRYWCSCYNISGPYIRRVQNAKSQPKQDLSYWNSFSWCPKLRKDANCNWRTPGNINMAWRG